MYQIKNSYDAVTLELIKNGWLRYAINAMVFAVGLSLEDSLHQLQLSTTNILYVAALSWVIAAIHKVITEYHAGTPAYQVPIDKI